LTRCARAHARRGICHWLFGKTVLENFAENAEFSEMALQRGSAATQDFEQEQTEKTERRNFAKNALFVDIARQREKEELTR
jgi:hypothetical protein